MEGRPGGRVDEIDINQFELTEFKDAIGNDHFHFLAKFADGSRGDAKGFGSSNNREIALKKAIFELVERSVFLDLASNGKVNSSNGFACHNSEEEAKKRAKFELFERDIVLSHWLLRIPPIWLDSLSLPMDISNRILDLNSSIRDYKMLLRFGVWGQIGQVPIYVCFLDGSGKNFGFAFSAIASENLETAISSLISDQRRAISIIITRIQNGISCFQEIDVTSIMTPQDHREYYFNPKHYAKVEWFLRSADKLYRYSEPNVEFDIFDPNIILPWSAKVAWARATSLQSFFIGVPQKNYLNFARLDQTVENFNYLNHDPHPLA